MDIISEILSVDKNKNLEDLKSKSLDELLAIRKDVSSDIEIRKKYEEKLFKIDKMGFNKDILKEHSFDKIKELYDDFAQNKLNRLKIIQQLSEKSQLNLNKLMRLSTERLKNILRTFNTKEQKNVVMDDLKLFGDGITNISTPLNIQKQRYNFLVSNGSKDNNIIRYNLSKKMSQFLKKMGKRLVYKNIMTQDINTLKDEFKILQKKYQRDSLTKYLLKHNYDIRFLNKQKLYVLEYLKSDLQPCEKGSRIELIRMLAAKNVWSRNTIRNWDIEKLKHAYVKIMQDEYSPLSEHTPNIRPLTNTEKEKNIKNNQHPRLSKSREEILKDITETVFLDLIS